jgi:hypothetical protein
VNKIVKWLIPRPADNGETVRTVSRCGPQCALFGTLISGGGLPGPLSVRLRTTFPCALLSFISQTLPTTE